MEKILSQKTISKSDMKLIIEMLEKSGSEKYCQNLIDKYWIKGEKIIKKLNIPDSFKNDFQELGTYLSGRTS